MEPVSSGSSVHLGDQEVSSRKNFLKLTGAGLAAVALFAAPRSASAQTSEADVETYGVDSIAQLKAVAPVAGQRITALGYYSPGDGGGGLFRYVGNRSLPDNGGTVVNSDDGAGQWLRVFEGAINVRWFGARGDGAADDRATIQAALDSARDGDVVLTPRGRYKVSGELSAVKHGVTLDFHGILEPHGAYGGYLLRLGTPALNVNDRPIHQDGSYGNLPVINIRRLTLDGLYQSKGLTAYRLDHFLWQNVTLQRIKGNGFKCSTLREASIVGMTLVRCNSGSEPNVWIADELNSDETNLIGIYGLTVVYCGGQALKIGPPTQTPGFTRQISFYSPQIHYLDQNLPYAAIDNNIKLVELVDALQIRFFGGNIRLGANSKGTLVSVGNETVASSEIGFHGVAMRGEGAGATGLDVVNGTEVRVYSTEPRFPNGTPVKDPKGGIPARNTVLTTNAFGSSAPLSSFPLGTSSMLATPATSGWPTPPEAGISYDVLTLRTTANAGEQVAFARSGPASMYKRTWNGMSSIWQTWVEFLTRDSAANDTTAGVVSTTAQKFAGDKTFANKLTADGQFVTVPNPAQTLDAYAVVDSSKSLSLIQSNTNVILRSLPTIAAGTSDGQRITLLNVGNYSITLRDQGSLRGSGLRLEASSVPLGPKGSVEFVYHGASGGWLQASRPVSLRS